MDMLQMPNELPANKSLRPSANNEAQGGDEAEGGHEAADDQEKVDADPARQGVTSAPQARDRPCQITGRLPCIQNIGSQSYQAHRGV